MKRFYNIDRKNECEHMIKPFLNQIPSDNIIARYNLWRCSKCRKWYSMKEQKDTLKRMNDD